MSSTQRAFKILEDDLSEILDRLYSIINPKVEYRKETALMADEAIDIMRQEAAEILRKLKTKVLHNDDL